MGFRKWQWCSLLFLMRLATLWLLPSWDSLWCDFCPSFPHMTCRTIYWVLQCISRMCQMSLLATYRVMFCHALPWPILHNNITIYKVYQTSDNTYEDPVAEEVTQHITKLHKIFPLSCHEPYAFANAVISTRCHRVSYSWFFILRKVSVPLCILQKTVEICKKWQKKYIGYLVLMLVIVADSPPPICQFLLPFRQLKHRERKNKILPQF